MIRGKKAALITGAAVIFLAGCEGMDFDLRNTFDGLDTSNAARNATQARPKPDSRGVISYPNYQVAVARRGDTVQDVAERIGVEADGLARFNGIDPGINLRAGEIIALPQRVSEPVASTTALPAPDAVDITTLAGSAIDRSTPDAPREVTATPIATTAIAPAPGLPDGPEPIRHKVERGETAFSIARLYKVPVKSLAKWNGLGSDLAIQEGRFLLIPIALQDGPSGAVATPAVVTNPGSGTQTPTPPSSSQPQPSEVATPAAPAVAAPVSPNLGSGTQVSQPVPSARAEMDFPAKGSIIRAYKKGRNEGIDIGASAGAPVSAAAAGTVAAITRDTNEVAIIVIKHDGGLLTVYTNVDDLRVKKGDVVKRGARIASVRAGDPSFVHFEVRSGLDSVDPMTYLE